jgi:hypothetical protein
MKKLTVYTEGICHVCHLLTLVRLFKTHYVCSSCIDRNERQSKPGEQ